MTSASASVTLENSNSIGRSAELDRAAEEALELPQVGDARVGENDPNRSDVTAGDFSHDLDRQRHLEFGELPGATPLNSDKSKFENDAFDLLRDLHPRAFVEQAVETGKKRHRLAQISRGRHDVE